jgi:hypothetical protein
MLGEQIADSARVAEAPGSRWYAARSRELLRPEPHYEGSVLGRCARPF